MTAAPTAFITGITGQDGSYLAEHLAERGYRVHGLVRDLASPKVAWLRRLPGLGAETLCLHQGDLSDGIAVRRLVRELAPDEVYNLGAQSHVRHSFDAAAQTLEANALGALHLLEAVRDLYRAGRSPRLFQAASSEIYGADQAGPCSERTPFAPCNPYGCAKVCAFHHVRTYRRSFGLFACNGILFNHESPRRDESFVTRKITRAAARIAHGLQEDLELGNLDVSRDWGYAPDYVAAIRRILQSDAPDDFVIATGRAHSLRRFIETAFSHVGLDWREHVRIVDSLKRSHEALHVVGDPRRIERRLGWRSTVSFEQLVRTMVDADSRHAARERRVGERGRGRDGERGRQNVRTRESRPTPDSRFPTPHPRDAA